MVPDVGFWDGSDKHEEANPQGSQSEVAGSDPKLRQGAEDRVTIGLLEEAVLCIQRAACKSSGAAADIRSRSRSFPRIDHMTNPGRCEPYPQSDYQQLSSGTIPPMLVFARAGLISPVATAAPAPRAGAARPGDALMGFSFPSGTIPRAPFSS